MSINEILAGIKQEDWLCVGALQLAIVLQVDIRMKPGFYTTEASLRGSHACSQKQSHVLKPCPPPHDEDDGASHSSHRLSTWEPRDLISPQPAKQLRQSLKISLEKD